MPATYTHHTFTNDVYKVIKPELKNKLEPSKDIFNVFGKSFDLLFFSNFRLGIEGHNHFVNAYFENIIKYIKDNHLEDNSEVLAYLYGSICHYVLDSTIHPYVYFKTGNFYSSNKQSKKYKGKHDYFEYMIDAIIYEERNNDRIYKARLGKELFPKLKIDYDLSLAIDYAFLNTFNEKQGSKYIKNGYKNFKFIMTHGMCSRFGIKAHIYSLIDWTGIIKSKKLRNLCYYIKKIDKSVLNLDHKKWLYPVDKKINYHYSFYDLYDLSIEKARNLINDIDSALNKNEKELKRVIRSIGNISYATGKNSNKYYHMKYFEY